VTVAPSAIRRRRHDVHRNGGAVDFDVPHALGSRLRSRRRRQTIRWRHAMPRLAGFDGVGAALRQRLLCQSSSVEQQQPAHGRATVAPQPTARASRSRC
jgi:hypothetical protein